MDSGPSKIAPARGRLYDLGYSPEQPAVTPDETPAQTTRATGPPLTTQAERHAEARANKVGLVATEPGQTYLYEDEQVWVGAKWDVAKRDGRFVVYRKGNWAITVGSFDLALAIVYDNEGFPNG
jgi:hypothetical protein